MKSFIAFLRHLDLVWFFNKNVQNHRSWGQYDQLCHVSCVTRPLEEKKIKLQWNNLYLFIRWIFFAYITWAIWSINPKNNSFFFFLKIKESIHVLLFYLQLYKKHYAWKDSLKLWWYVIINFLGGNLYWGEKNIFKHFNNIMYFFLLLLWYIGKKFPPLLSRD